MGMAGQTLSPGVTAPARRRITVGEFERMIAANVWPEDERIELIKGELIAMPPINARHAYAVDVLTQAFIRQLAGRVWVSALETRSRVASNKHSILPDDLRRHRCGTRSRSISLARRARRWFTPSRHASTAVSACPPVRLTAS